MISLKRNKKTGELVMAKGTRVMKKYIYQPNQKDDFKVSRSKFGIF